MVRQPKVGPMFISTCHNCGFLGHIRHKSRKPLIRSSKQDLSTHVRFLTNQVSHLIELMIQLIKIISFEDDLSQKE